MATQKNDEFDLEEGSSVSARPQFRQRVRGRLRLIENGQPDESKMSNTPG